MSEAKETKSEQEPVVIRWWIFEIDLQRRLAGIGDLLIAMYLGYWAFNHFPSYVAVVSAFTGFLLAGLGVLTAKAFRKLLRV